MTGQPDYAGEPGHAGQPDGQRPQAPGKRAAFPDADPTAPSFDDEIHAAVRYENGLAVKALLAIALVALVLALRVYFFG
jgi:hypothetical protein